MKIYIYDKESKVYLGDCLAQKNPVRKGEYLYPANSTTVAPPEFSENETAVFNGESWVIVPDYRGEEQINLSTGELETVAEIGDLKEGYTLYSDYLKTDLYRQYLKKCELEQRKSDLLNKMEMLDRKRIRAICEPDDSGKNWLEFYNSQMEILREQFKEINNGT